MFDILGWGIQEINGGGMGKFYYYIYKIYLDLGKVEGVIL